jgi:hypothetical protein
MYRTILCSSIWRNASRDGRAIESFNRSSKSQTFYNSLLSKKSIRGFGDFCEFIEVNYVFAEKTITDSLKEHKKA